MELDEIYQCQLGTSEQKMTTLERDLIAHAVNPAISLDEQGRITFWNSAAEAVFGYTAEEANGHLFTELLIPSEWSLPDDFTFVETLQSGKSGERLVDRPLEAIVMNKRGEQFVAAFSLFRCKGESGSELTAVIRPKPAAWVKTSEQQERLTREIQESLHGKRDLDDILNLAVRRLGEFMKADRCVVWLYDAEKEAFSTPRHEYRANSDIPSFTALPSGMCPYLSNWVSNKEALALYIPDLQASRNLSPDDLKLLRIRPVHSLLHIPLIYQGHFYGFLRFHSVHEVRPWDEETVKLIQEIAATLSQTIDELTREAKTTLELQQRLVQREMLALLSQRALSGLAIQSFLELTAARLAQTLGLEFCRILEMPSSEATQFEASGATEFALRAEVRDHLSPHSANGAGLSRTVQDPLAAYAVAVSRPVVSPNLSQENRFQVPDWLLETSARSAASVLIYMTTGVYGVLEIASLQPRTFSDSDISLLQIVSNVLGIAIERERAEKEAEEKNNRYEMLLDTGSYAVWDWNLETGNIAWNENKYLMLGLSPDAFVPESGTVMPLVHPEDRPHLEALIQKALQSGDTFETEYRLRHSTGRYIYVFTQFTVIRNEVGEAIHLVGMCLDITHRKQQELRLMESEERFRTLADDVPVLIWMADPDRKVIYVNRSCLEFMGLELKDVLGRVNEEWVNPEHMPEAMRIYEKAVQERKPYTLECQVRRYDGEYRWLLYRGVPRLLPNGEFLGFIGVALDITERKLIEQQLQESEERFRNMADAAPVLIGQVDCEGKTVYLNQACLEFANAPMETVLDEGWMQLVFPPDRETLLENYRAFIPKRAKFTFEYRAIRHDGSLRHILNTAAPRFKADGEFVGYMIIGTDITEQKEAISRFQRLSDSNVIGIAQWRTDGQVLEANEAFLNLTGYTRQEMNSGDLNVQAITPQEFSEVENVAQRELKEHGACPPYEKQYTHKDGHRVDILVGEASLQEKPDEDVAFVVDISARKQTERALQEILDRERLRHRLMDLASRTMDMDELFNAIATEIGRFYQVDRCMVVSYEPMPDHPERLRPAEIGQYRVNPQMDPARLEDWPDTVLKQGVSIEETLSSINTSDLASAINADKQNADESVCPVEGSPDYLRSIGTVLVHRFGVQACLRIGMRFRELGYGCIALMQCDEQRIWKPDEEALIQDLSYLVGSILYQAKLHEQEQQIKRDLEWNLKREQLRRRILQVSGESGDIAYVADVVTEEVGRFFGVDRCCIFRYQPAEEDGTLSTMGVTGQYLSGPDIKPLDFEAFPKEFLAPLALDLTEASAVKLFWMPTREAFWDYVHNRMRQKTISPEEGDAYCTWITDLLFDEYGSKSILRIDIVYRGRVYGTLTLHFCREHKVWREEESDVLYDIVYHIGSIFSQAELHEKEQQSKKALEQSYNLIRIVSEAQGHFISNEEPQQLFADLVNKLMVHTDSRFGFIGEVLYDEDGKPYLKTRFLSDISWDELSLKLYEENELRGFEFRNMETLFGRVITSGEPLISNDPLNDPRRGGLPSGHPPLTSFMGMPLLKGSDLIGMVGIANRPGGYDESMTESLQPYLLACANIIWGLRAEREKATLTRELKHSEQSLKMYALRLQKSNQELEQFATIASHDLQAPLRKVAMFSDFIKSSAGDDLPKDCYDYIERIQKSVLKMQALISDLLVLSRVTRKGKPFTPVDLGHVIQEVLSDLETYCRESGGTVEVLDSMTIEADETQMHQIFQNLIGNSLKFHQAGVPPVVRVSAQAVGHNICEIRVQDEGIGFDEKYLDRIFDVFERLHGENAFEGTGMGLAIVKKIAERHGGTVAAEGEPGHGATFTVRLPIRH